MLRRRLLSRFHVTQVEEKQQTSYNVYGRVTGWQPLRDEYSVNVFIVEESICVVWTMLSRQQEDNSTLVTQLQTGLQPYGWNWQNDSSRKIRKWAQNCTGVTKQRTPRVASCSRARSQYETTHVFDHRLMIVSTVGNLSPLCQQNRVPAGISYKLQTCMRFLTRFELWTPYSDYQQRAKSWGAMNVKLCQTSLWTVVSMITKDETDRFTRSKVTIGQTVRPMHGRLRVVVVKIFMFYMCRQFM